MEAKENRHPPAIIRGTLLLRGGLLGLFALVAFLSACSFLSLVVTIVCLLLMGLIPIGLGFLKAPSRQIHLGIALTDFVLASLANTVLVLRDGSGILFPLYVMLAIETVVWWGRMGALMTAALSGGTMLLLALLSPHLPRPLALSTIVLVIGWSIFAGFVVHWAMQQWQESRTIAVQLARQEETLSRSRQLIDSWAETASALHGASSPRALLEKALRCAMDGTASSVGLVAVRQGPGGEWRTECWEGFALLSPWKTTLQRGERLPVPAQGDVVEIKAVLEVPFRTNDEEPYLAGRIVVGRKRDDPYREHEKHWLRFLAGYVGVLLEGVSLRQQLHQVHIEMDSLTLASGTLASPANLQAALEMACRDILRTFRLEEVWIVLAREQAAGGHILVYPANGPTRTETLSLRGRGISMLRRFLDSGTQLVMNRPGECRDILEAMGWEQVQSLACFPLSTRQTRWGFLCALADRPGAFSPRAQQSLTLFCGEMALAIENAYLRQALLPRTAAARQTG